MLLEREKDASALINVLLGNQNEFVAWRSQTDTRHSETDRQQEELKLCDNTFKSFEKKGGRKVEEGKGRPRSLLLTVKATWLRKEIKFNDNDNEMRHATRVIQNIKVKCAIGR